MNKTNYKKKVVLVYDEIFLRESLNVNTRNMTYLRLEDFGDVVDAKPQLANHALVLMIQSLAEKLHQPIAVFASKGPIKGTLQINEVLQKKKYYWW